MASTISFSGLASGLDTSSWVEAFVNVKKEELTTLQTNLKSIQTTKTTLTDTKSKFTSLRTAIEKLTDAKFGGSFDLFAKNSATSSNNDIFSATVTSNAARQTYDIKVQQLATYTKATSKESASAVADDSTKLSNLGITSGSLTTYVNGKKTTINIGKDDTLGDLKSRLAEAGIKTEIDNNGVLKLSAQNSGDTIHIGATTDGTNLTSLIGLTAQEDGSYASTNSLFKASVSSKLTAEDSGFNERIKAGTFTIGDATFTIDDKTTLSSLISEINNNDKAQAYAYWDDASGKLSITSKKEGASYINIEAGTSNFTDVMGFTASEYDSEGKVVSSKMYTEAQELGLNAIFSVNGTQMTSTSNTVTSDISRMDGVTLTLKRANTEDDGNTTLKVSQDTSQLKEAVKSFITAYNETIAKVDEVTASGADLHGETSLTSLNRTLKRYSTSSNLNDGVYKLLYDIGIKTASADGNNLSADTYELSLDEDKFMKALEENPDSVKSILTGDTGVLSMMEDTIEQSLKASVGFFDVKTSTLDSNIKKMEEKITKKNTGITTYKSQLEAKFQKMEQAIASMQQNYSSFLSS